MPAEKALLRCIARARGWLYIVHLSPKLATSGHFAAAGYCDEAIGACYCPSNTTYGRIPAPMDAPMDAPPLQHGRPMNWWCQPNNSYGGTRAIEDLYGPQGWCMAAEPSIECECNVPGWGGDHCDEPVEQVSAFSWLIWSHSCAAPYKLIFCCAVLLQLMQRERGVHSGVLQVPQRRVVCWLTRIATTGSACDAMCGCAILKRLQ
jgi:hypothetical protein